MCNPPSASLGGIVEGRRMKEPLRSSRLARRALALLLAAASTVSPASTCPSDKPGEMLPGQKLRSKEASLSTMHAFSDTVCIQRCVEIHRHVRVAT